MAPVKDFWSQDRTTIHQKNNWFEKLPLLQRITYILLLLFVIGWFFYLGMNFAMARAPELPDILDGTDWIDDMGDADEITIAKLEGTEVVLLVGADKRPGEKTYRTDTIILAFFNGETNELKLLSIPRDSYVQLPGKSTKTRINEAYFYGGITLLQNTIEYTFGINVDKFVEMDFNAFVKVIDLLEGVEIDVPRNMKYLEEGINLKKGLQTLNGQDALGFVRFRHLPMGDIDRIANQQAFIRALAAKIASNATVWKAPKLVNIAMEYTRTNYTLSEAMKLGSVVLNSDLTNIGMHTLKGDGLYINGVSFWVLNETGCAETIAEITGGEVGDMHIISDGGRGTARPPAPKVEEAPDTENPEGENPDTETPADVVPDTEGSWSADPGEDQQTEQPAGEGGETDPATDNGGNTEEPVTPAPQEPIVDNGDVGGQI